MAQLIKLKNYISRYDWDIYHYPARFIHLKKENWLKLKKMWDEQKKQKHHLQKAQSISFSENKPKFTRLFPWNLFSKKDEVFKNEEQFFELPLANFTYDELKHYFLNELYPLQLKWATSTLSHISFIDQKYENYPKLKFLLQRFPDNFLMMYEPIFLLKNATIECNTIFITPLSIEIICFLEYEKETQVVVSEDRLWQLQNKDETENILSPLYALRRTERIVKSILRKYQLSFPIEKTILSRTNSFIYWQEPYQTNLVDRLQYETWLKKKQNLYSPLKARQLKIAEKLLNYTKTLAIRRPEWEDEVTFD